MINIFAKRTTTLLCVMAVMAAINSCTFDDTDLQNSIDDLTSRVEALEDFQEQVQGDIASLQDIISKLNSSVTVNNVVDNGDGSWTINFSDGTSVTIRNGQDGEDGLTPPSITVVEEDGTYYWAYEDADGNTEFILDGDGNKIPVTGEAPRVRINPDTGNWEISTDGGKTWEDTGVKAEGGDGDSFFSQVEVRDGILYIVLADGTVIEVPLTAELAFDFGTDEEVLYFAAGESKTLEYTMSGAETYTITKPDGWRASIEGEGLVITAPASENTFAETEGVVSVILISAGGQSLLAEQYVIMGKRPGDEVFTIDVPSDEITPTSARVISTCKDESLSWTAQIISENLFNDYGGEKSEMESYFLDIIEQSAEYYGFDTIQELLSNGFLYDGSEADDYIYTGLLFETKYMTFAVGMDYDGDYTTDFYWGPEFTTLSKEMLDLEFKIDIEPNATSVLLDVYPSDMDASYLIKVIDRAMIDEEGYTDEDVMTSIISEYGASISMFIKRGNTLGYGQIMLTPDADYYAVAFGVDPALMTYNSKMTKEAFRTTPRQSGKAYVEGQINNYWHDADLIAYNPEYQNYVDPEHHVVATIDLVYNDDAEKCLWVIWEGDLTDMDYFDLYNDSMRYGTMHAKGEAAPLSFLDYGQYTVCAIGIDINGTYGQMHTELVNLTEDGRSNDFPLFDEYFNAYIGGMAYSATPYGEIPDKTRKQGHGKQEYRKAIM